MLALGVAAAPAQTVTDATSEPVAAQIDAARSALQAARLTEAQKQDGEVALERAAESLQQTRSLQEQVAQVRQQAEAAAAAGAAPDAVISGADSQWAAWRDTVPADASSDVLEQRLARERSQIETLRGRADQLSAQLGELIGQPAQGGDALAALRRRAEELRQPMAGDAPPALAQAQALRRAAEQARVQQEIALRELERDTAASRQVALESQLQAVRQQIALRDPRVSWLGQRIAQFNMEQLATQAERLQAEAQAASAKSPAVAQLARDNAALALELKDDTLKLADEREQASSEERDREQIATVLRDARSRLTLGGGGAAIGHWLWQQRMATPAARALELRRREVQAALSELRLRQYTLSDKRQQVTRLDSRTEDPALVPLRAQQQRLLGQLTPVLAQRVAALEQSDRQLGSMIESAGELRRLMNQELLWVPSHAPIDLAWLQKLPGELVDGAASLRVGTIAQLVWRDMGTRPLAWGFALVVVGALWALRRQAQAQLRELAARTRDVLQDRFVYTAQALGWGVVRAMPWPAAVLAVGLLLQSLGAGRVPDIEALGMALTQLSGLVLVLALLRALLATNGVAEAHLRWPAERLRRFRRAWLATCWILLPASFMGLWALNRDVDVAVSVHARLASMIIAIGMALLTARLLRTESPAVGLPPLVQRVLRVAIPLAFVGVVVLAWAGYVYSGSIVLNALLASLAVLVLVQVVHGLLTRWVLLGERQLALRQRAADKAGAPDVADLEAGDAHQDDAAALELIEVGAQSRRILQMIRLTLLLVGLGLAWSDVLPALLRLESYELWHFSEKNAAGEAVQGAVTLADVLLAAVMLIVGLSLTRNIPGMVELLLSARGAVAPSTRYTIATLLRYGVTIVASMSALSLLGLRWSQLQWMAAALTVGLGFGLQEIFANFVSGLILLVERPFRVGDTITIDGVSGSVTRIRTRATVIQDWDNKEIIIPNKTFITNQVINWTLSDSVTRLTVPVGVAYGSPVRRVHELLLQAANEHAVVMKEPPPRSWFLAFGASSLDFELRVYVPTMGDRLATQNDLLLRINDLFGAEGIEIAFPQMDLHVRDWPRQRQSDERPLEAAPGGPASPPR